MSTLDFSGILQPTDPELPVGIVTDSGLRTRDTGELREFLTPHLSAYGITRVAHLTGFDSVGLPVHMAVKPQGQTLSSGSGKGVTRDASWVSAVMECAEQAIWENLELETVVASESVMRRMGVTVIPGDQFPMSKGSIWTDKIQTPWTLGWDIVAGEEVYVPETLATVSLIPDGALRPFIAGSNGLASGAHVLEAVLSGLQEAIERDGMTLNTIVTRKPHMRCDEILRETAPWVAEQIERGGLRLEAVDATTEIGVPIIVSYLYDAEGGRTGTFKGAGAGTSTKTSLVRAVTEAAQARCLIVAGARDDNFESQRTAAQRQESSGISIVSEQLSDVINAGTGSVMGDLNWMVDKLVAAGFDRVIVIRHTPPEDPVQVVRVLVPGLEGYPFAYAKTGKRGVEFLRSKDLA
jgi:ribosomal protein S12 methylthiotransferase accessory factor